MRFSRCALSLILALAALMLCMSCKRTGAATTAPTSAAYTDGFEVVVFDVSNGTPANVRCVPLAQAEQAIAISALATITRADAPAIAQQLSSGKPGDSQVKVTVTPLEAGGQQLRVSFHESSRTFAYAYAVDDTKITPLASEYRDLGKSKSVRYSEE